MNFCLFPRPDNTSWQRNAQQICLGIAISSIVIAVGISCAVIALEFESFETFLYAGSDSIALFCVAFVMINGILFRAKIKEIFFKLQQNYDQCECKWELLLHNFECVIVLVPPAASNFEYIFFSVKYDDAIKYSVRADRIGSLVTLILAKCALSAIYIFYSSNIILSTAIILYKNGTITPQEMYQPYPEQMP